MDRVYRPQSANVLCAVSTTKLMLNKRMKDITTGRQAYQSGDAVEYLYTYGRRGALKAEPLVHIDPGKGEGDRVEQVNALRR
ncbi:unnamed protein product [Toxocara canis]|uniref:Transposase n=1 Tax=Toxocara canis TaxID=6265 RepID=A0A183V3B2_TOXCA|nr:unnamed protein product [Toxocara canis]